MSKAVIQPFEEYQKARMMFVQTVAELADRDKNVDALKRVGAIKLLGPLLSDPVSSVRQSAALAIGRLAGKDEEVASLVINQDKGKILGLLLESLDSNNKFYKKAACFVIANLTRWNKELTNKVVAGGAINFLVNCLDDYDSSVKESATYALGFIAKHGPELASAIIDANAIEPLSLCLQEPEISIKRRAITTMSQIAMHSDYHTQRVCDKDNLNIIMHYLQTKDTELRRKILLCLGFIAHNSSDKATLIIQSINSQLLEECISGSKTSTRAYETDLTCQKNALILLYEIANKGGGNSAQVSGKIKCNVFIDFIDNHPGEPRLYGIPILATLALHSKEHAEQIKRLGGHKALAQCLYEQNLKIISLACMAISNMSIHNADITNSIAEDLPIGENEGVRYYNIPYRLLELCLNKTLPAELRSNSRAAMENIIRNCSYMNALLPLLDKPNYASVDEALFENILSQIVRKLHSMLHENKTYKKKLIETKTLKKLIRLKSVYKSLEDDLKSFSDFYSQEIMNYYSDEYEQKIKEQLFAQLT